MTQTQGKLSDHELSRVIDFLRKIRAPFDERIPSAKPDPYWNIVLELVDSHLQQLPVDRSTLIEWSQTSYGTGNRLITRLIEDGLIDRVPRRGEVIAHPSGFEFEILEVDPRRIRRLRVRRPKPPAVPGPPATT